jgi:hypothetical protein
MYLFPSRKVLGRLPPLGVLHLLPLQQNEFVLAQKIPLNTSSNSPIFTIACREKIVKGKFENLKFFLIFANSD